MPDPPPHPRTAVRPRRRLRRVAVALALIACIGGGLTGSAAGGTAHVALPHGPEWSVAVSLAPSLTAPTNTAAPVLGAAPFGLVPVTCSPGTWTASPAVTGYTYLWRTSVDGGTTWVTATGTGAATATYTPALTDTWALLRCDVTAASTSGNTVASSASQPVQPADLLFSTNYASSKIGTHSVSPTGQLTRLAITPTNSYTRGLALTPDQRFLYASVESGAGLIQQYAITESGSLTVLSPDISSAGAYDIVVTPDGRYAYSANNAASGTVGQYAIGRDGRLSPLATPTIAAGNGTAKLAITSDGKFLYAVNWGSGDLSPYSIGSDGQLTSLGAAVAVGGSTGGGPRGLVLVDRGAKRFLYVAGYGTSKLFGFEVDGAGGLSALTGLPSPTSPNLISASPDGQNLYVALWTSAAVAQYAINGTTGALTALSTATAATGTQPFEPFVHPSGQFAYVGGGATTYQYGVSSGALTALSPSTEATATDKAYRFQAFRPVLAVSDLTPAATRTNAASTTYSLSFTRPVTGLAAGDFSLSGTATGYAVTGVSGSGAGPYTVTVSAAGARTDGTLTLKLATNSVSDLLGTRGPTVDFPMLTAPTVTVDTVAPTVSSDALTASSRSAGTYTVTFSKAVTGVAAAGLSLAGTSTGWTVSGVTGSGAGPYTFTLANATAGGAPAGTLTPTVALGAGTDAAGNQSTRYVGAAVTFAAPTNTAVPTATGTLKTGYTLTGTSGTWPVQPAPTYAYQWQVSSDGATGWASATGDGTATTSYKLAAVDAWRYVRLTVTATNGFGSATASSSAAAAAALVRASPVLYVQNAGINNVKAYNQLADGQLTPLSPSASWLYALRLLAPAFCS